MNQMGIAGARFFL